MIPRYMEMGYTDITDQPQLKSPLVTTRKAIARYLAEPVVSILIRTRITPNVLTLVGLLINLGAAGAIIRHHLLLGGFLVLISGLFDLADGALARATGQATRLGALLDSTADRLSEAVLFGALIALYIGEGSILGIFLVFAALVGSFLVSYIRARAEGLGIDCQIGLYTRVERVIVLALGLLLNQVTIALWLLLVFTYVTVVQRLLYVRQQARIDRRTG